MVALWFVPLVAILLAAFFTLIFWVGKSLYKGLSNASKVSKPVLNTAQVVGSEPLAPVVPFVEVNETDENPPLPPEVEVEEEPQATAPVESEEVVPAQKPDTCPATAVPVKITKPKRITSGTSFRQGLKDCLAEGMFPCGWEEDNSRILVKTVWRKDAEGKFNTEKTLDLVNKLFWVMSADGPIRRGAYDRKTGELINETIANINGTVTQVTQGNTTWYFDAGVLTKIRTSPYDNCNFHDWFFIDSAGNQDVCQCAYDQPNCCARSPYTKGMQRDYCEIFTRGDDFCK